MLLRRLRVHNTKEHPMQEFIPFEDDWSALDSLDIGRLVPYQVGRNCLHGARPVHAASAAPLPQGLANCVPKDGSGQIPQH
jgi:hypothetical protein